MIRLIINADDFGVSNKVNNAIYNAATNGKILTSTSLIAGSESFKEAVDMSKELIEFYGISVGAHLTLSGKFNLSLNSSSLIDKNTNFFHADVIKKIKFFQIKYKDIINEFNLQIEKIKKHRIKISHLDLHHHLHRFPVVLMAAISVAKKFDIPFIRSQKLILSNKLFPNRFYRYLHHLYLSSQHNCIDGFYDFQSSNLMSMIIELSDILKIQNKTIELVMHPGAETKDDLFLNNAIVKKLLENNNVSLVSYRNLFDQKAGVFL